VDPFAELFTPLDIFEHCGKLGKSRYSFRVTTSNISTAAHSASPLVNLTFLSAFLHILFSPVICDLLNIRLAWQNHSFTSAYQHDTLDYASQSIHLLSIDQSRLDVIACAFETFELT
jgi:hypothetical protein